jgi:hypothetical protein
MPKHQLKQETADVVGYETHHPCVCLQHPHTVQHMVGWLVHNILTHIIFKIEKKKKKDQTLCNQLNPPSALFGCDTCMGKK